MAIGGVREVDTASAAAGGTPDEPRAAPPRLYAAEAVVGGAALAIALLSWSSLALAHARSYSLAAAAGLTVTGLALVAVTAGRAADRPRLVLDPAGLATTGALALVAAVLFFPGFPYGVGDKDPGGYVSQGVLIARTGDWAMDDPVLDKTRIPEVTLASPGARLAGQWIEDAEPPRRTIPQFYHLWSGGLASAFAAGGYTGLANLNPLCGVLSVCLCGLAVRRVFGLVAGSLAGLLLAANMLEVWQAKYQTSEVFNQMLVLGAMLGVVLALQTGWRPAAGVAGLLLGLGFLARADGIVLILIAVAVGCALIATGRFDARAGWFATGLALTLPHGLLQAYHFARLYTVSVDLPELATLVVAVAVPVALALALRRFARPLGDRVAELATERRAQFVAGLAVVGLAVLLLGIGFLRPRLFGIDYFNYNGQVVRSFDEQALRRLSWFFTLPGLALMVVGLALIALRRWAAAAWALVLPGLLLFPLYAYEANNSSRLMWWNRRFVPVVVPTVIILIAVALVVALTWKGRWRHPVRVAGAAAATLLLAVFLGQSLPLRTHHEFAGSFEITQRISRLAGDRQGVYLWQFPSVPNSPASLFASPVWLQEGEISALLPTEPDPAYVREFVRGFPGQPVFLVAAGGGVPEGYEHSGLIRADRITATLPFWAESDTSRPSQAGAVPVDLTVWRVTGT
jgi:Dolichyl-phosphate-mannose-protein mannosyltransferase